MTNDQKEAIKTLQGILKPGDTLHTILRNVSRSGMSRQIGVIGPEMRDLTWLVGRACGYRINDRNDGLKVSGCGSDMGFEVVYNLGRYLFPDGFGEIPIGNNAAQRPATKTDAARWRKQKHKFCGRNGDPSGWDNDGGYALKQRWL